MDYGNLISRSFAYTKDALVGKWMQWILLVVLSLIQAFTLLLVPLLSGYVVRVLSGKTPAPEVNEWGRLFVDGWKLNIITLVYMIPAILIFLLLGGLSIIAGIGTGDLAGATSGILAALAGTLLALIVALLIALLIAFIALFAILRFAHTGRFGEAFNFSAILEHIGNLGWGTWILAVLIIVVIAVVYSCVVSLLALIPFLGWIIVLFLNVAFAVFYARYLALVYESVPAPA